MIISSYYVSELMQQLSTMTKKKVSDVEEANEEDEESDMLAVEEILINFYQIGIRPMGERFSDDDWLTLGSLLYPHLPDIRRYVKWTVKHFTTLNIVHACRIRSGLEFLMNNYANYPIDPRRRDGRKMAIVLFDFRYHPEVVDFDACLAEYVSNDGQECKFDVVFVKSIAFIVPHWHEWWRSVGDKMMTFCDGKADASG
jgi:hypothetical protein